MSHQFWCEGLSTVHVQNIAVDFQKGQPRQSEAAEKMVPVLES